MFRHLLCLGLLGPLALADDRLDAALDAVAPSVKKWASICVVSAQADGTPRFDWHDYRNTGDQVDFWPASTVKLYAAIAALELLNEEDLPLDTVVAFEHRESSAWRLDCARSVREMLSEVFRRSSNEDYTLLLRMVGIDRINTRFLTPARGFPHSALMRGYVKGRPWEYVREEPQRLRLTSADGTKSKVIEHTWSGRSYSSERGGTVIDAKTGNLTSPRELAECMRRVMFHEHLPETERYRLTKAGLDLLRRGGGGLVGLQTKAPESGPSAWVGGVASLMPRASFFHKCGVISNYALEVAFIDDAAQNGPRLIMVPVVAAGAETKPSSGETLIGEMAKVIAHWAIDRADHSPPAR